MKIGCKLAKTFGSLVSWPDVLTASPILVNSILLSFCLMSGNSFPTCAWIMRDPRAARESSPCTGEIANSWGGEAVLWTHWPPSSWGACWLEDNRAPLPRRPPPRLPGQQSPCPPLPPQHPSHSISCPHSLPVQLHRPSVCKSISQRAYLSCYICENFAWPATF